jgi:hypothetical protein
MEEFLRITEEEYTHLSTQSRLLEQVGQACSELRAWGVLDSVLKMVQKPQDLYAQPERILSYFVSPPPLLLPLIHENESVKFAEPVSQDLYPRVSAYLKAAIESLPTYVGQEMAQVSWSHEHITIAWSKKQEQFEEIAVQDSIVNPHLMNNLVHSVEHGQKELELRNQELVLKNKELEEAKANLVARLETKNLVDKLSEAAELAEGVALRVHKPCSLVIDNVMRLSDYMARSHQLITLLVGQNRLDPQVKEAMRRVDWNFIREEYPRIVEETATELNHVKSFLKDLAQLADEKTILEAHKSMPSKLLDSPRLETTNL